MISDNLSKVSIRTIKAERAVLAFRIPQHEMQNLGNAFKQVCSCRNYINTLPIAIIFTAKLYTPCVQHKYFETSNQIYYIYEMWDPSN